MAATVDELGVPTEDGVLGTVTVDLSVQPEHLVWNLESQTWIGRPRISCTEIDEPFGILASGPTGGWNYGGLNIGGSPDFPAATTFPFGDPNSKGFMPHHFPRPDLLWAAGLRLQEMLFGEMMSGSGGVPRAAINWYELDEGDPFLSPNPENIGVALYGIPMEGGHRFACTGWQNSPVAAPTKTKWYPLPYVGGVASYHLTRFTAMARMVGRPSAVGGPDLGAFGGADFRTLPPITNFLYSQNVADDIPLASGQPVGEWVDASPYGRNLKQATSSKKPLLVRNAPGWNGHAVVRFDGVDDVLHGVTGVGSGAVQPYCIFMALKQYAAGGTQQVWHESSGDAKPLIYRYDATNALHFWAGGTELSYNVPGGWAPNPRLILSAQFDGASSSIWLNNNEVLTGNMGSAGLVGASIGAAQDDTLPAKIEVAEYVVYFTALTAPERTSIVNYLNAKYAVF